MTAQGPEDIVKLLDRAFAENDLDTFMSFYESDAVVMADPGRTVRGDAELRSFFRQTMKPGASARQIKTHVLEADGIALFLSRWALTYPDVQGQLSSREFVATAVFRKQEDGAWKVLIDNSFGPLVLK
jgi:ketosteroid isomerase-like protein